MKKALFFFLYLPNVLWAQKWVDTTYQITIHRDSIYGTAIDFAGNVESLKMDIAYPISDTPPSCGRPLVVVFYGGAWMAGSTADAEVQQLMMDFAKRGYVAVAPNYRLGMFQTATDWNCNISSMFNIEWNCLNAQDSSEWYRAYYRAVQDAKGAIRYMVNHQTMFNINPNNIFTTGFSAGGFTALGVAFLDHPSEWLNHADAMVDAQAPNARYDAGCVKKYGWDTAISSMNLARPSLGTLHGNLNYPASTSYKIKAVGNLFGGMLYNLLDSGNSTATGIYGFHQPNDLIVPYKNERKVFDGLNACAYGVCNIGILNRPFVYSSPTLRDWATAASVDFKFDSTKNNTDCAGQISNPSQGGHQLDNWSRTRTMAIYFASKLDTADCEVANISSISNNTFEMYPNPATSSLTIRSHTIINKLSIYNTRGMEILRKDAINAKEVFIDELTFTNGIYFVNIHTKNGLASQKLVLLGH